VTVSRQGKAPSATRPAGRSTTSLIAADVLDVAVLVGTLARDAIRRRGFGRARSPFPWDVKVHAVPAALVAFEAWSEVARAHDVG
jgi:hypothetical protein